MADALLSDEASSPEVLFFAAKILQNKIYYDFAELDPRQCVVLWCAVLWVSVGKREAAAPLGRSL